MNSLEKKTKLLGDIKLSLLKQFGVKKIGLFGSHIKGKNTKTSDLDILVELDESIGLLKFIELEIFLSEILGIKVDLVTVNALKPRIGEQILKEVIYI